MSRENIETPREPVFNVPGVVLGVLAVFIVLHVGRYLLPYEDALWWLAVLAFVPARYTVHVGDIPGGVTAAFTSPFTHMLLHEDLMHLSVNALWLLPTGSVLARRLGNVRFLAFAICGGLAGALAFYSANPGVAVPVIGASGAVAALMGGVMRILFSGDDDPREHWKRLQNDPAAVPCLSLGAALTDRRVVIASAVFIAVNLLAFANFGDFAGEGNIAWEAHLGGYFFGLLLFQLFDVAPQHGRFDTR